MGQADPNHQKKGILKNLGLNEAELKRVVDEIRQQNPTAADKAGEVLQQVLKP